MSFEQLQSFVAIVEEGAVVHAAARLHITQPPLSRRLRNLEDELGAALFVREARGMRLTPAGEALLPHARRILAAAEEARRAVDHYEAAMIRTSVTDPIEVAWLTTALPGRIGLTFAPGKRVASSWHRDLAADLDRLRGFGVDLLAPLLEDHELEGLAIPDLVEAARARGVRVQRLPIADGGTPDTAAARALVDALLAHAAGGGAAVVHCRGGLGRAGTLAACCLVALGADPDAAIAQVRAVRPGAIENRDQEAFVRRFR